MWRDTSSIRTISARSQSQTYSQTGSCQASCQSNAPIPCPCSIRLAPARSHCEPSAHCARMSRPSGPATWPIQTRAACPAQWSRALCCERLQPASVQAGARMVWNQLPVPQHTGPQKRFSTQDQLAVEAVAGTCGCKPYQLPCLQYLRVTAPTVAHEQQAAA